MSRKQIYLGHAAKYIFLFVRFQHGCTQALYMLSVTYPVGSFQSSWEVIAPFTSKKRTIGDRTMTAVKAHMRPARKLKFGNEISCSSGILYTTFEFISSTWMAFDLQAHQEALKVNQN